MDLVKGLEATADHVVEMVTLMMIGILQRKKDPKMTSEI